MGREWAGMAGCEGMIKRQFQEGRNNRLKEGTNCRSNTAVPRPSASCVLHSAFTIKKITLESQYFIKKSHKDP